jgi:hypothetical protein
MRQNRGEQVRVVLVLSKYDGARHCILISTFDAKTTHIGTTEEGHSSYARVHVVMGLWI